MGENVWVEYKKVLVRKAVLEGKFEVKFVKEDGKEVKMIGSLVERFWSEKRERKIEGFD